MDATGNGRCIAERLICTTNCYDRSHGPVLAKTLGGVVKRVVKRTLFVIVDALTARVVRPAMLDGKLPTLSLLESHGFYRDECISIFPSITPAATAALVTGQYPATSGIAGACWLDRESGELAYHGDDLWAIWNHGIQEYFRAFLTKMNFERLQSSTIYDLAAEAGLSSSCFNLMWFRGPKRHKLHKPWLLDLISGGDIPSEIAGPDRLLLGDFVDDVLDSGQESAAVAGLNECYGFRDETTAESLLAAARAGTLSDVNVAYFPTNDFRSHKVGPEKSMDVVEAVDKVLGEFVEIQGGIDRLVEEWQIVVTGDHSHSTTTELPERAIELDELLSEFKIAPAGQSWSDEYDLVAGPNMRTANFYCRDAEAQRSRLVEILLSDRRVDQAIWESDDGWHVQTVDRGTIRFAFSDAGVEDEFGGRWSWSGDLSAVDARVVDGHLSFDSYPNAFERIACGAIRRFGDIWFTAKPGFEFKRPSTETHDGGSHGSLHRDDSIAPLIGVGISEADIPAKCRIVDMLPLLSQHAGLLWDGPAVGKSRVTLQAALR